MSEPLILNPPINPTLIVDGAGLDRLAQFFSNHKTKIIGWDLETELKKDYFWRKTRTCQFGDINEQFVIDLLAFTDGDSQKLADCQGNYGKNKSILEPVLEVIRPVLCTNEFEKVGVNLAFEYEQFYWGFGERTWNFFSCDLVERAIVAGAHSLKDYEFFSLASLFERYFKKEVNKELQTSFNMIDPLTQAQIDYAALDTRLPLAIRQAQLRILEKDKLFPTAEIENNAIGSFTDMHVHGQNINRPKWQERDSGKRQELTTALTTLDNFFIPLVGSKHDVSSDEEINKLEQAWKSYNVVTPEEVELKKKIRKTVDINERVELEAQRVQLEAIRKARKEELKTLCGDKKKQRTKIKKLIDKCEGNALINYGSGKQLLEVFGEVKGLKKLEDTDDKTLIKYTDKPIIAALRTYRELSKQIDTYGIQWTQEWVTGPSKEEGWLHPGDGRLHARYNQYDAATGRSSSSSPNGQNIPHDPELRACFIADPPDENSPEGYVLVTADMSGAELRIIAEEAQDTFWIDAFARDEDLHSVGTELLYPDEWPKAACKGGEIWYNPEEKEGVVLPPCAYYKLGANGLPQHKKCKCPRHIELRNNNKEVNFKIAYGGTEYGLADSLKIDIAEARRLLGLHREKNPRIWEYLEDSGTQAKILKEARSMFGRRRFFPEPTWELATERAREHNEEKLRYPEEVCKQRVLEFWQKMGRKPKGQISTLNSEHYFLTHREPNNNEISQSFAMMYNSIEREGKNHPIQSTNADIAKIACGCGYDSIDNKPFLWHTLPLYGAKLVAFIHDEFVVQVPKRHAQTVADLIGDAFLRAGRERMKRVEMKFEYKIAEYWCK